LGIESSCDDTAAAILCDGKILANVAASQSVHEQYGGVVPELASRAHQSNIIPVIDQALKQAGISHNDLSAIAVTQGPGLMGSLLVGNNVAKGLCIANNLPLIGIVPFAGTCSGLVHRQRSDFAHVVLVGEWRTYPIDLGGID